MNEFYVASGGYIYRYSGNGNASYYIADKHIHGPGGYTQFYVDDGGHIDGPSGYTRCYMAGEWIQSPTANLTFLQ
jgi:hypothetical protein